MRPEKNSILLLFVPSGEGLTIDPCADKSNVLTGQRDSLRIDDRCHLLYVHTDDIKEQFLVMVVQRRHFIYR